MKAAARALGIGLLFVASYRVTGRMPGVATWVFLGVVVTAFCAYNAWREAGGNRPRRP